MTRSKLPVPVREVLDNELPEDRVHHLWEGIANAGAPKRRSPKVGGALSLAIALAIALLVFWRTMPPGPLRLASGAEIPMSVAASTSPTVLALDDGSRIDVAAGGEVEVLANTGRTFVVALRKGSISLDVEPGGPRGFRVEAGRASVEVVGTQFDVERADGRVRVSVARGVVVVRSDQLVDGVLRLTAGGSVEVSDEGLTRGRAGAVPEAPAERGGPAPGATERTQGAVSFESLPKVPDLAPTPAVPSTVPAGSAPSAVTLLTAPTVDELLAEADRLRRFGRYQEASEVLRDVLATHPGSPQSPLVELSLGRLYLDSLGSPALAARHLERALALGLPATLVEDAWARLVEAHARSGNLEAARGVAARYHARYPGGRRGADIDRWVGNTR